MASSGTSSSAVDYHVFIVKKLFDRRMLECACKCGLAGFPAAVFCLGVRSDENPAVYMAIVAFTDGKEHYIPQMSL